MNRISLNVLNNSIIHLDNAQNDRFVLDMEQVKENQTIVIPEGTSSNIVIINIKDNMELLFEINDRSSLLVSFLTENPANNIKITANVGQSSVFTGYFADFINTDTKGQITVNLNKEGGTCDWHLASLANSTVRKEFDVSVYHNAINTFATMDNYGVCRDDAKLIFSGVSKIEKGSSGSKTHQNAKIMVFDERSNGVAKPILKIDENDIEASHAAIVGKINDEHIFYLTSRGLSEDEAKRLITYGYLKPILKGFDDEEMRQRIEGLIEG